MRPPLPPENGQGYFEIIEGPFNDSSPASDATYGAKWSLFGDLDDVLMFTTRGRGGPFIGKTNVGGTPRTIESPVAEVVYFLVQNGPVIDATTSPVTRLCTLYRRVFLIDPGFTTSITLPFAEFYDDNDLSVRYEEPTAGTYVLIPNTLGDLTKRENRFAHYGDRSVGQSYGQFPFLVDTTIVPSDLSASKPLGVQPTDTTDANQWPQRPTGWPMPMKRPLPQHSGFLAPFDADRSADDVLLTNVVAFDVQVWDPGAPIFVVNGTALEPRDVGYPTNPNTYGTPAAFGAYVDLGYYNSMLMTGPPSAVFNYVNPTARPSGASYFNTTSTSTRVYDTWSLHYENNGVDEDSDGTYWDAGTNGLDDGPAPNPNGLVDDQSEFDTLPPYSAPLRGIRITLRVYEPNSKQIREAVIIQNFAH